jgi:NADPH-dependent ferric siderophore reductase
MSDRPQRPVTRLRVLRIHDLTPHMRRIYAGGPGFESFRTNEFTDKYVKLIFTPPGTPTPDVWDPSMMRKQADASIRPVTRTYTIRSVDQAAGELAIDFVLHGDEGLAGLWAARARPGDEIAFFGPGGAYAPSPAADWHLMAGDEAALPAIGAAIETVPEGAAVHAFIEVDGPDERQSFASKGKVDITWLYRHGAPAGDVTRLVETVKSFEWLPGTPHVFIHGESGLMAGLRRWLLRDRAVPTDMLSLSCYWRTGLDEMDFRDWKAGQRAAEEAQARRG